MAKRPGPPERTGWQRMSDTEHKDPPGSHEGLPPLVDNTQPVPSVTDFDVVPVHRCAGAASDELICKHPSPHLFPNIPPFNGLFLPQIGTPVR